MALERIERDVELSSRFGVIQAHDVAEHDRGPILEGELDHGGGQVTAQLGRFGSRMRVGAGVGIDQALAEGVPHGQPGDPFELASLIQGGTRSRARARRGSAGGSQDDRVEPGAERRSRVDLLDGAKCGQECLLDHVLGRLAVTDEAVCEQVETGSVAPYELGVGRLRALPAPSNELALVLRFSHQSSERSASREPRTRPQSDTRFRRWPPN